MLKKSLISFALIAILALGIEIFYISKSKTKDNITNVVENELEISSYVIDDCINEWSDYTESVEEQIEETSQNVNDDNKKYILREKENFINIYYINEKKEEILYKVTDISTEYLGKEDIEKLKKGIEVEGIQNLYQLLEDFE